MARVTIEDCLEQVPSRFALVIMAAVRTKQLMRGARTLISNSENKAVVNSLREIAAGHIEADIDLDHTKDEVPSEEPSA